VAIKGKGSAVVQIYNKSPIPIELVAQDSCITAIANYMDTTPLPSSILQ